MTPTPPSGIDPALRALFDRPPVGFGPTPLWWWSGEPVTDERIDWQLRRFAEGGIHDLVIIGLAPSGPLFGAEPDDPTWFTDAWWRRFDHACATASELGTRLWFYDQIGFSGANVQGRITHDHPEAAGRSLRPHPTTVADGRVAVPPGEHVVALYGADRRRRWIDADGVTDAPDGDVLLVTAAPTAFDYLSPTAVGRLIDTVHGEFERRVGRWFGEVIVGSFQDELPATSAWTATFPEEFARRRGYDLLDHLPSLFGPGDEDDARVRADYAAVRAELTEEALFEPLGRWHDERGLLVGADQSHPARAGLPLQSTQIYVDYPRTHRHLNAVGSDHEGDSRFHASLARLYGHPRVWLEAFHSSGWGGTLEDTWDWLIGFLRAGATLYNPHASYYATVGGWFEWAPPSTDWRQPYWSHYADFADAVARMCALGAWGRYDADVAVLHPTTTMQAALPLDAPVDHFLTGDFGVAITDVEATQRIYRRLVGSNDWFHHIPSALESAGIGFDIVDDASVQRATRDGHRMRVRDQRWTTVLLPATPVLEEATALALIAHLDAGGRVVSIGQPPAHAAGRSGDDEVVRRLAEHPSLERIGDADAAVGALDSLRDAQYATASLPISVRRDGETAFALLGGAYPDASDFPRRDTAAMGRVRDVAMDRARYADEHVVRVRAAVAEAELWDPTRGTRVAVPVERDADGASVLRVRTGGAPLVAVVWREGTAAAPAPLPVSRADAGEIVDVSEGWTGELVPTLDNTWGDLGRPVGRPLDGLQVWSLDARERPDDDWTPTSVTQGQRALVREPTAAPPEALDPGACDGVVTGTRSLGEGWDVHEWSSSRGLRRDRAGELGSKGRVPDLVIETSPAGIGEEAVVRTVLVTEHRGEADLVLLGPAPMRAWWNGTELELPVAASRVARVTVERDANVLEYRTGASPHRDRVDASGFALFPPGGWDERPEHIAAETATTPGRITFEVDLPGVPDDGILSARLVVGCVRAAEVRLDGVAVGRQEKVEYYESERGANPAFFLYDLAERLRGGARTLSIDVDTADPDETLWADLAIASADGSRILVSGPQWRARVGDRVVPTRVVPLRHSPPDSCDAVRRPHPLARADWRRGAADRGGRAIDAAAVVDVGDRTLEYRTTLPAGTLRATLPLEIDAAHVLLDGAPARVVDGALELSAPAAHPVELRVSSVPTAIHRGGAGWSGPIEVDVRPAPITLGDWRDLGLAAWSGGLRYRRRVDVDGPVELDLGDLRGAAEVRLDGEPVLRAFCAPFRTTLPHGGELEITVRNTLGPFLSESTATDWVLPSQLASGLYGPVTLRRIPD